MAIVPFPAGRLRRPQARSRPARRGWRSGPLLGSTIRIALYAVALIAAMSVFYAAAAPGPLTDVGPALTTPFPNCTLARAAGYTSIPRASPLYVASQDADNDGFACEPLPRRW